MALYAIVIVATISIAALAFVLSRIMMRRQQRPTPPGVYEDEARIDEEKPELPDMIRTFATRWPPVWPTLPVLYELTPSALASWVACCDVNNAVHGNPDWVSASQTFAFGTTMTL